MQPVWSLSRYLNSWSMRSGVPSLNRSAYTCRHVGTHHQSSSAFCLPCSDQAASRHP